MTSRKDLKRLVRERMEKTGERYATAYRNLVGEQPSDPEANVSSEEPKQAWRNALIQTSAAEARSLLAIAVEREPRLTPNGIGIYGETTKARGVQGLRPGVEPVERELELAKERAEFEGLLDQIAASADWIKLQRRTTTFNLRRSSYGYKHAVESWFRRRGAFQAVANGSFIAAALGLGFELKVAHLPNVCFRFSERTVKALEREPAQ